MGVFSAMDPVAIGGIISGIAAVIGALITIVRSSRSDTREDFNTLNDAALAWIGRLEARVVQLEKSEAECRKILREAGLA